MSLMKIIFANGKYKRRIKPSILAIGIFDGVHRGHQHLIQKMLRRARQKRMPAGVLTFFPHPMHILEHQVCLPWLIPLSQRLSLIESLGVDFYIVINFTKRFSQLTPKQFVQQYLQKKIGCQEVFVGSDFRFGCKRTGDVHFLKEAGKKYGFQVHVVSPLKIKGEVISSTRIRRLISDGALRQAERLLGRPVGIEGKVIQGDRRGRRLGFPTANLNLPHTEIVPPTGVYIVNVILDNKRWNAMANIGKRPSFKRKNTSVNIEVHVFDFNGPLYGKNIIVEFLKKIREEKTFFSERELINQLQKDERKAKLYLLNESSLNSCPRSVTTIP